MPNLNNTIQTVLNAIVTIFILFTLASCSSKLKVIEDLSDTAFDCIQDYAPEDDPMVRKTGEPSPESSFLTINDGKSALEWRLGIVDSARHTLDIQYFLWKTDETGALLLGRVLTAANRGVRVRVLMDDFDSTNWNKGAVILAGHPNIEIRVFNPFKSNRSGWAGRGLEMMTQMDRLNHRMHNKLLMADNKAAIVGGRNIGNEYFGAGKSLDYRDYDLLTVGPVVAELGSSFELFWDSVWSYRISDLSKKERDKKKLDDLEKRLNEIVQNSKWLDQEFALSPVDWSDRIAQAKKKMITAPARAVYDCPPPEVGEFPVQTILTLNKLAEQAKEEIFIISPYMIPLEGFHEAAKKTTDRGVAVRILTNSLAAADHTIAFSGYKRHRIQLLKNGVILHEIRPQGPMWETFRLNASTAKHISLHAKIGVIDRRWVYVGSLNLDPRSVHWNTELGILIDSDDLASRILRDFKMDLSPENSWTVEWRLSEGEPSGKLVWISDEGEITKEPSKGIFQKISLWFFSLFPLDEQL
jgi:putative cardiolipin synthase